MNHNKLPFLQLLLFLLLSVSFSTLRAGELIPILKEHVFEMSRNPFFKTPALHALASAISNKGNTTDLSLRELYWNTYQDDAELERFINTQQADGSWADINYHDNARSNWQPTNHVSNLLYLSRAYITPGSQFYQKKDISIVIHKGIDYWFRTKPVCLNWWYNQIAVPRFMGLVFLFVEDELTPDEKAQAIDLMNNSGFRMTGQNKVWLAGNVLIKSLLLRDEKLASAARDTIASEIFITTKEGIQPDFSFHQHGPQQQFGNYGLAFISSMAYYANVFGGTKLAFTPSQIDVLRNYVFQGLDWVMWHGNFDVSACNRQLFKQAQSGKALTLCLAANQLSGADRFNAKLYSDLLTRNLDGSHKPERTRTKHFWRSDLTVFRGITHYLSVRSCSPRLIGTEFTNNENKMGHFISDGFTSIMRRGDEYKDIFPIWDWNRLPGVTAPLLDSIKPQKDDNYKNQNSFVGGLTRGANGISTFHLARNGVEGKKSWFYLDGKLVCLGADIKTNSGKELVTGVNQCLQHGKSGLSLLNGKSVVCKDTVLYNSRVSTVWHDSVGYYFPERQNISLAVGEQKGDWHQIADPYDTTLVTKKVFKLWINHGRNANLTNFYQYFVIPHICLDKLTNYVKHPQLIVQSNTGALQAVSSIDNRVLACVFHEARRINVFSANQYVEVFTPGLLLIEKTTSSRIIVTVADPTQKVDIFKFKLSGKYKSRFSGYVPSANETLFEVPLPRDGQAGSSVSVQLN